MTVPGDRRHHPRGFAEVGFRVLEEVTPYVLIDFVAYPDGATLTS